MATQRQSACQRIRQQQQEQTTCRLQLLLLALKAGKMFFKPCNEYKRQRMSQHSRVSRPRTSCATSNVVVASALRCLVPTGLRQCSSCARHFFISSTASSRAALSIDVNIGVGIERTHGVDGGGGGERYIVVGGGGRDSVPHVATATTTDDLKHCSYCFLLLR